MDKKGFTLIELLAVIVLLAVVMAIAVPAIGGITGSIQNNMLDEKVKVIEDAAILLGQDVKDSIINSDTFYKDYPCKSIIVSELVPTYLNKDNDNACLKSESSESIGCIVDPSNKENYLDKYEVIIYYQNKRIHAKVDVDNNLACS